MFSPEKMREREKEREGERGREGDRQRERKSDSFEALEKRFF